MIRAAKWAVGACGILLVGTMVISQPFAQADPPASSARDPNAEIAGVPHDFTQTIPGSEVGFNMVAIPGGTFKMGSPESEKGHKKDEGPQIEVQVDPFFMQIDRRDMG